MIPCLFAKWNHKRGKDVRPSMSVSVGAKPSRVVCFTCAYRNSLVNALNALVLRRPGIAKAAILAQKLESEQIPNFRELLPDSTQTESTECNYSVYLKSLLKHAFPKEATTFLLSKGVSESTAKKFKVAFAPKGHWDDGMKPGLNGEPKPLKQDTLVLPVLNRRNQKLTCVGAMARPLGESHQKYFTIYSFPAKRYLFGEHLLHNAADRPIALVEGHFDVMHLVELGINAVGLQGVWFGQEKLAKIKHAAPRYVVILTDPDDAGQKSAKRISQKLDKAKIAYVAHKLKKDPKHYSLTELHNEIPTLFNNPFKTPEQ